MSAPTVDSFLAAGHSEPAALERWYAHRLRDQANSLGAALSWARHSVLRRNDEQTMLDTLRKAAWTRLTQLQFDLARECDPWFEVRQ